MHLNEVAFAIVQNQQHVTLFELPTNKPGTTIKSICLEHCSSDVEMSELFLSHWAFEACLWRNLYLALQPLALTLDDPQGCDLFTRASVMLRSGYSSFRTCGHLIQATQAFTWAINVDIPADALPLFEGCKEGLETQNLPLSFALPR